MHVIHAQEGFNTARRPPAEARRDSHRKANGHIRTVRNKASPTSSTFFTSPSFPTLYIPHILHIPPKIVIFGCFAEACAVQKGRSAKKWLKCHRVEQDQRFGLSKNNQKSKKIESKNGIKNKVHFGTSTRRLRGRFWGEFCRSGAVSGIKNGGRKRVIISTFF